MKFSVKIAGIFAVVAFALTVTVSEAAFMRDLTIGSTGADVTELQNILISNGYSIPAGATGYFGAQTQAALAKWQAAVGISPAAGYFGPITRAKLAAGTPSTPGTGTPSTPGSGLQGGDGDIQDINKTTSGTETTLGEGDTEDVLGFDLEADDNSDLEITSVRVEIGITGSGVSTRLNRYLEEVAITLDGDVVGSVDASDFSRDGATSTATISLDDAIVEAGEEGRFYVTLTAKDSINDTDLDNGSLNVVVDRVRVEDASGAVITEDTSDEDLTETVDFEDSSADDDAKVKSSSDTRDAGLLKVDETKASDEFDILSFEFDVDEDSSDLIVTEIPVTLTIKNASSTQVLDVNKFLQDMYLEVDGEQYDDYAFNVSSVATSTTTDITATFSIDEGDLEIAEGDTVDAVVYVKFGKQAGNYAEGSSVKAVISGSAIDAENPDGDDFDLTGTANGKTQTVQIAAATIENFAWSTSAAANNSTGIITFQFTVTAEDEDFSFTKASLTHATSGTATTSAASWAIASGADYVNLVSTTYTVDEGESVTFEVSFDVTGPGSSAVTVTSVAGQEVPSSKQYSGLKSF